MSTGVVADKMVVSISYTLKDKEGELIDSSGDEPLEYLQGFNNIIPGLEKALDGLKVGEKKQVEVQPEDGYGQYNAELKFTMPKSQFTDGEMPEVGMMVQLDSPQGPLMAQITTIEDDSVQLDMNHPLAGEVLFFDVEVKDIRDASEEEISHGHPHGPDGHHH